MRTGVGSLNTPPQANRVLRPTVHSTTQQGMECLRAFAVFLYCPGATRGNMLLLEGQADHQTCLLLNISLIGFCSYIPPFESLWSVSL